MRGLRDGRISAGRRWRALVLEGKRAERQRRRGVQVKTHGARRAAPGGAGGRAVRCPPGRAFATSARRDRRGLGFRNRAICSLAYWKEKTKIPRLRAPFPARFACGRSRFARDDNLRSVYGTAKAVP